MVFEYDSYFNGQAKIKLNKKTLSLLTSYIQFSHHINQIKCIQHIWVKTQNYHIRGKSQSFSVSTYIHVNL